MFFKEVIGQEAAKLRLRQEVQEGRIPHAQLFCGPWSGKTSVGNGLCPLHLLPEPQRKGQIKGKLLLPGGVKTCPVVLIIAGSGPTDMDGNSAIGNLRNNSLKFLAEGLAAPKQRHPWLPLRHPPFDKAEGWLDGVVGLGKEDSKTSSLHSRPHAGSLIPPRLSPQSA